MLIAPDPYPIELEERYNAVGENSEGRKIFLVFMLRHTIDGILLCPTSARYMHRKEIDRYEKRTKKISNPQNRMKKLNALLMKRICLNMIFYGFKLAQFEFMKKSARLELRLPDEQLAALKQAAKKQGIPYTRLVRQFIDQGMQGLS